MQDDPKILLKEIALQIETRDFVVHILFTKQRPKPTYNYFRNATMLKKKEILLAKCYHINKKTTEEMALVECYFLHVE